MNLETLDPFTPVYRTRHAGSGSRTFHLDPKCPALQQADRITTGRLQSTMFAGRKLCALEGGSSHSGRYGQARQGGNQGGRFPHFLPTHKEPT